MKTLVLFIFIGLLTSVGYSQPKSQYVGISSGQRILNAAQKYGMTDSELNYLIDNTGPDLTLKDDKFGATALIHACANNRPNMVIILLEKGANKNEVDYNGETCLIAASRKGNTEVVKILLDKGALTSIVGTPNKTAHDYAVEFGHIEVARLLGGPPKQKVSFKTIAGLAVKKQPGQPGQPVQPGEPGQPGTPRGLSFQKYAEQLGKISTIINKGMTTPGKGDVEKVNEIGKITGFSDLVKRQMQERDKLEEKLRLEKEAKRAKFRGETMAKLKAIAAFNNLYLDVKAKREVAPAPDTKPGVTDTSKLSFSDATNKLLNDMELKLKKKEEDMEKEKQADIEKGAAEKIQTINSIIIAGIKGKDISGLKNEPEEKLKEKIDAIKNLVDVKESKQSRWVTIQGAKKKVQVFSMIQTYDKAYQDKINALKREEEEQKRNATINAKLEEERKQAELAKMEAMERDNFYKVVSDRAKVAKFTENLKGKGKSGGSAIGANNTTQETKVPTQESSSSKVLIDDVRGVMKTPDFHVWLLSNRDCKFSRSPKGNNILIISKLKLTEVKATNRMNSNWFINQSEVQTPPNGGKACPVARCSDFGVYTYNNYNNPKRERFFSNIIIQMGNSKRDHFEIYSTDPGNPPVRVPVTMCSGYAD